MYSNGNSEINCCCFCLIMKAFEKHFRKKERSKNKTFRRNMSSLSNAIIFVVVFSCSRQPLSNFVSKSNWSTTLFTFCCDRSLP